MAVVTRNIILPMAVVFGVCVLGALGLRDMQIKVPEAIKVGDTVSLACDYDLEEAALYTIKWYRYDEEFYRYVPKESPPTRVFLMDNLNVDVSRSNSKEVTLTDVKRETSGEFKCEVSADAPLFHTEIRSAHLLVAEVPDEGPVLRIEMPKVAPGAKLRANCTTPASYPAMNITWIINDKQVLQDGPKYNIRIQSKVYHYDALPGLESVRSSISFSAVQELFKNGKMKLSCVAALYTLYRRVENADVQEDAPQLALIMVPTTNSNYGSKSAVVSLTMGVTCLLIWKFSTFL